MFGNSQMTDEELQEEIKWQREHEELHRKHQGHDAMHAEMFIVFIVSMVIAQICLMIWRRKHVRSYQIATLLGLWLIPLIICLQKFWWRFLLSWVLFTSASWYIWWRVNQTVIMGSTPRLVYKYFLFLHKMSYIFGIIGYFALLFTLIGINLIFGIRPNTSLDFGIHFLFYGLYYGVLSRDLAHILTDRLACKIGYFTHDGLPKRVLENGVCAVCGNALHSLSENGSHLNLQNGHTPTVLSEAMEVEEEKIYTLSCNHVFHEFCIRGWCVVGKLQTCPYCKEKVDLKRMFKNPWEKPHLFYGQLLDWVRYLVAWQPIIVMIVHFINTYMGLE
uniref:RING-type domain-containing protein n=1 Tax=Meloidogyne incognita TaxID=6306 RepID=A0A914MSY5_MELIC